MRFRSIALVSGGLGLAVLAVFLLGGRSHSRSSGVGVAATETGASDRPAGAAAAEGVVATKNSDGQIKAALSALASARHQKSSAPEPPPEPPPPRHPGMLKGPPGPIPDIYREVDMTPEEEEKVNGLFADFRKSARAAFQAAETGSQDEAETRAQTRALEQDVNEKLRGVLGKERADRVGRLIRGQEEPTAKSDGINAGIKRD